MKHLISILIISGFFLTADAETCVIRGNAGTYAGEILRLYTYSDYITMTRKVIAESEVDDEGYFKFTINTDETFEAFLDLDVFTGYIIIEPGKEFNIVLPKKTVRRHEDIMNPYFKPYEFYVRILNDDNTVTAAMKKFDALYEETVKIIFKNPKHINPGLVENKIKEIDDSTSFCKNPFFKNYKKYKFLELKCNSIYKNKPAVVKKNFSEQPVLYNNPAYNKLLKTTLGNVLFDQYGDTLFKTIGQNPGWYNVTSVLYGKDLCFNKEFCDYFLFVNLYNRFYRNDIYKSNIVATLFSAKKYLKNEKILTAVNNFLDNSSNLIAGNASLNFRLPDTETYMHSLSDYRGKFVYLGFYSVDSYACKKDILLIADLAKQKKDLLKIVLVFKENNAEKIKKFLKKTELTDVTVLKSDDGGKVIDEYNVYVYPTYFLINPEGRLSLISAPGPSEDFEAAYFKIKQEWRIKKIREQNK